MKVLLVEDGEEYTTTFVRFLGAEMDFVRAGNGADALGLLQHQAFDVVFLDMRFDRVAPGELLGDLAATADRFNGDPVRARQFLEDNQGSYILAAVRAAGFTLPAVFSHDFDSEPRRWATLQRMYAPVSYLPDNAPPARIREVLQGARA
jgi:CheY-like chemotaxis protein